MTKEAKVSERLVLTISLKEKLLRLPGAGVGLVARSLTGSEDKLSVNEVGLNRKLAIVLRCSLGRKVELATTIEAERKDVIKCLAIGWLYSIPPRKDEGKGLNPCSTPV